MTRILLTGLPGAGKSTAARLLADEFGLGSVNVGDALLERLLASNVSRPDSRWQIGPAFLSRFPPESIHAIVMLAAKEKHASVFDGVRLALTGLDLLRERGAQLWHIETDPVIRAERLRKAGVDLPVRSFPVDYEDQQLMLRPWAREVLTNNGSLRELRRTIELRWSELFP